MALVQQFIRFTSDAGGLERTFRLVQALLMVVTSSPLLLGVAATYMSGLGGTKETSASADAAAVRSTAVVLAGACERVNLWRRFYRVFRFVDSFHAASLLMGTVHKGPQPATWLELAARTLSGMYLFLESLTVVDAMGVTGLAVWGPERAKALNVEGQRYWFLSLGCSVLLAVVRMLRVTKDLPPPMPTEADRQANKSSPLVGADEEDEEDTDGSNKISKLEEERLRLRQIVKVRMGQRRAWIRQVRARLVVLGRRGLADFVDMLAPGAVVGWTPVTRRTIGITMVFTTLLTGYDIWLRCGREVADMEKDVEIKEEEKAEKKEENSTEEKKEEKKE